MLPKAKWLRVWFITALPQSWGQGVALDQEPPGGGGLRTEGVARNVARTEAGELCLGQAMWGCLLRTLTLFCQHQGSPKELWQENDKVRCEQKKNHEWLWWKKRMTWGSGDHLKSSERERRLSPSQKVAEICLVSLRQKQQARVNEEGGRVQDEWTLDWMTHDGSAPS